MWLLSCDGDLLQGKKLWLRPGSAHLLGRTSNKHADNGERVRYIDHGSVSRKHLILTVAPVQLGDSSRVFGRSRITATDGSKSGSTVDGEPLKQASRMLDGESDHVIQLGNLPTRFRLEWRPVVLTFNVGKSAKTKGTALREEREKLEGADIKLTMEYVSGSTTHVIAKKRNIPIGLQALLQAKWLVTDSFVNALADKCRRRGGDGAGDPGCSPLEDDFEANWPKEISFLTSTAGEPRPRPNDYLKPDPARAELFSNHTFVFFLQEQLDTLMPVITAGGGKAVLCEYSAGRTTVESVIDFVKHLVGKKHAGRLLLSQESGPGGVVLVRIPEKAGHRSEDFLTSLSVSLDQRTIEQNELLDAILTKDVKSFRLPLSEKTQNTANTQLSDAPAPSSSIARPLPASNISTVSSRERGAGSAPESPPAGSRSQPRPEDSHIKSARQPYRRTATVRTNITFDDDFDPSQAAPDDSSDEDEQPNQVPSVQAMDAVVSSRRTLHPTETVSRKRSAAADASEDDAEVIQNVNERLMPAYARAKRQKKEAEARGEKSALDPTPEPEPSQPPRPPQDPATDAKAPADGAIEANKGKKVTKRGRKVSQTELEMKEQMRRRREREDEERRKDEEDLQRFDGDIRDVKPVIEEFEVPMRPRQEAVDQIQTGNDHPEWRGRQNFKGFRSNKNKAGNRPVELESQPVVVALEPVPGKDQGLVEDYWLKKIRRKGSQSQLDSQSQQRQSGSAIATANGTLQLDDTEDEDDALAFRRRNRQSRGKDAAPTTTEGSRGGPSQTMRTDSQKVNGKRPATKAGLDLTASGAPASKRIRRKAFLGEEPESDSEEDDPLAFKRKRR